MNKQAEIIAEVLKQADSKKRNDIENEWFVYMQKNLKFPFQAEIDLVSYSSAVCDGDIVSAPRRFFPKIRFSPQCGENYHGLILRHLHILTMS